MVVNAAGNLVSPLPIARRNQVIDPRASHQIGLRKVGKELLTQLIKTRGGNDVVWERCIAVQRVEDCLSNAGKISSQHFRGRNQSLKDIARAPPPPFVVGEEKRLVLANRTSDVSAVLVIGEARSSGGRAEELSRLERAVADEIVSNSVEAVCSALGDHVEKGRAVAVRRIHEIGHYLELGKRVQR